MRSYFPVLLVLGALSCKNGSPEKSPAGADSVNHRDTVQPSLNDTVFTAFGNEPFWALYVIRDQKLLFHPADGPDVEAPYVAPVEVDSLTRRYQSAGDSAAIQLLVTRKDCSDGMSDMTHRFATEVKVNAATYNGCGRE